MMPLTLRPTGLGAGIDKDRQDDRVATLEEAKAQFQKSWDAWKAWAGLQEVP